MGTTQTRHGRGVARAECALIAQATFRASPAELPALRKTPDPAGTLALAPSLLRHADEQTVVGLVAVIRAIQENRLESTSFADWAVLAAPRYLGRSTFEQVFPTFQDEGAWGVSPHLIPAHSLHSPSGTISQALKAQGPNLGVGGTPGGEKEALLYASTMLLAGSIPGVWVVLTDRIGLGEEGGSEGDYAALAMALVASKPEASGARLRISPDEVRLGGASKAASLALGRWLTPGLLRVDEGHSQGSIPRPHFRQPRQGREGRDA